MNNSTMGSTGIHAQNAASNMRYIETLNAEPSKVILFRAATQQQIFNALSEEELDGISVNINLAKQGLYDPDRRDTIFHVANVITPSSDGTYQICRSFVDAVISSLQEQPELMYVK